MRWRIVPVFRECQHAWGRTYAPRWVAVTASTQARSTSADSAQVATLARLKAPRRDKLMEYLGAHALYASAPFAVSAFALYESTLTPNGSLYTIERKYPLGPAS